MLVEYINPANKIIVLTGPNKEQVQFGKFERKMLPVWFNRYVPRYLKEVSQMNQKQIIEIEEKNIHKKHTLNNIRKSNTAAVAQQRLKRIQEKQEKNVRLSAARKSVVKSAASKLAGVVDNKIKPTKVVGRAIMVSSKATEYYREIISKFSFPISNDIGVGILSYNRLDCVKRIIDSIRQFTDLSKTFVIISDESTDKNVKNYLAGMNDICVLNNNERIGIAGNTNRLLRCLERFRYKIILNDDVEVLRNGWEHFYANAIYATKIRHFCMRQPGVYGASQQDGILHTISGIRIRTIQNKPHGAVMAFDNQAFEQVGYFDESFGVYGMEHVDWSHRVSISGIQQPGYHDVDGSHLFYKVHSDKSAVEDRNAHLAESRQKFNHCVDDKNRIYVKPTKKSEVEGLSFIVPFRGNERTNAIKIVLLNIKAQLYPRIEIIMVEQDHIPSFSVSDFPGASYLFVKSENKKQQFNKSAAFNAGVMLASCEKLILHDADMVVRAGYAGVMFKRLSVSGGVHAGGNVLYLDRRSCDKLYKKARFLEEYLVGRIVGYFEGGSLGCLKSSFINIGGFHEGFVGYGVEDCEFFSRLSLLDGFDNNRTEDFMHLWHGRSDGWNECHDRNKGIERMLKTKPMSVRISDQHDRFVLKYLKP
jgi:GT2 family glycosyltransferase